MLLEFGTSSYRNIRLSLPVNWTKGISFVFGNCASGKTNLCRAMKDIQTDSKYYKENQENTFYYSFEKEKTKVEFAYHREKNGIVNKVYIQIPEYHFSYHFNPNTNSPVYVFKEMQKNCTSSRINRICDLCYQEIHEGIHVIIPEDQDSKASWQYNKTSGKYKSKENLPTDLKQDLLIMDDADIFDEEYLQNELAEIIDRKRQAILMVRRSKWIDKQYGDIENYYYMKRGEIKRASEYSAKNIHSVEQLNNLFLKGFFNE